MGNDRFDAVVFDLFNTIVRWDASTLPTLELRGRRVASTIPLLEPLLERSLGNDFDAGRFVDAYLDVMHEIEAERRSEAVEITCQERFERALRRLEAPHARIVPLAVELTRTHMTAVRSATSAPPAWAAAVRRVGRAYRIALLSNFDDGSTGHAIVRDTGLGDLFETVVISAEVGWRKPNPVIFRHVLETLDLEPGRVLHVGDTPREDVAGARGVGMPVAWLSADRGDLPEDVPAPDFTLPDVTALPALLGVE